MEGSNTFVSSGVHFRLVGYLLVLFKVKVGEPRPFLIVASIALSRCSSLGTLNEICSILMNHVNENFFKIGD